jgi:hypothetical protein
MGANAGPDIVSGGLVLALDAADNNSFRGEPTTNTFSSTNDLNASPWIKEGAVSISPNSATAPDGTQTANTVTYASTGNLYFFQTDRFTGAGGFLQGQTYTISIWAKGAVGGESFILAFQRRGDGTNTYSTTKTLTTEWKRYTYTRTLPSDGAHTSLWGLFRSTLNTTLYVWNPQIEQKSYATRFTTGTRGTTVATGGGWADISGNDNHGEILNGTSTSNDGSVLGALDFDGTNDYIDLGTQLNDLTVFTVEGVFKTNITGGADTFQVIFGAGPLNTSNYTNISIGNLTSSYPDESFHVILKANTLQFYVRNGANFYFDQKYHHFVVNTEANKNAVYIDGVEQSLAYSQGSSAVDWGGINSLGASNVCAIGRRSYNGGDGYFNGNIPFIRVYNRSLTEKEILANYNSLKTRFRL